jgi:hypothetical protein
MQRSSGVVEDRRSRLDGLVGTKQKRHGQNEMNHECESQDDAPMSAPK